MDDVSVAMAPIQHQGGNDDVYDSIESEYIETEPIYDNLQYDQDDDIDTQVSQA